MLERKKTLNVFKDAKEALGSYDDIPVAQPGTDPMPHLSRNRCPQPFFLVSDEPEVLLSEDRGPNAGEYVLHALASCLTGALVYHAAARGISVKGIATRLEGDIDLQGFLGLSKDARRGFKDIRVVFDIDADCDDSGKQELIEMAQAHSPVFDMLSNGLPVSCRLDDGVKKTETV